MEEIAFTVVPRAYEDWNFYSDSEPTSPRTYFAKKADKNAASPPLPPEEKKALVRFHDAVGRKFNFPFHLCAKWTVGNPFAIVKTLLMNCSGHGGAYSTSF